MALSRNSAWKGLVEVLAQSRAEDALSILQSSFEYLQGQRFHSQSGTLFWCLTTVISDI